MNDFISHRLNSYLPSEKLISSCETDYGIIIRNKFQPYGIMGGDLWGIRPLNDNEIAIYLFDFLGHGETAGKEAAFLYSLMNDMFDMQLKPGNFITELNKRFCNSPGFQRYATMFLCIYNRNTRTLSYSSAAHQPFFHISLDCTEPTNITKPSVILGAKEDALYESHNLIINNGELLITYSGCLARSKNQVKWRTF